MLGQMRVENLNAILNKVWKILKEKNGIASDRKKKISGEMNAKWNPISIEQIVLKKTNKTLLFIFIKRSKNTLHKFLK